ncbi:helix-turn-helix domain-containing protein [Gluconacetobacter aggeris]|uniref:Helix-turn-helix domain-containing protein n=1 Tax=Gluconacetobacter aggeris TaxID=1286186 RepID=A0A7W4NY12_9PROT|nr:helix-turn-helix domain-containing protein [Gluconacetobacter aggeris]
MIQRKANTYRLFPTSEQQETLARIAGSCRLVYNLALEQRRDWWRRYRAVTGKSISYNTQSAELTVVSGMQSPGPRDFISGLSHCH